jgi:hypothetical protein
VKADATLLARNKQTHQIVARKTIGLQQAQTVILRYGPDKTRPSNYQAFLFTMEMVKDCYYEVEVNELRAYQNLIYFYHQMPNDGLHNRRLLTTLLIQTSPGTKKKVVGTYKLYSFSAILGCSVVWILSILFFRTKRFWTIEVWLALSLTICSLIFTAPFDFGVTPVVRLLVLVCFSGFTADTFVARKALGKNLGGLYGTFSFFFTLASVVQLYVGFRVSADSLYPIVRETMPSGPLKNIAVGFDLIRIRMNIHKALWGVLALRLWWLTDSFRQLVPLLGWCSFWIYEFAMSSDPYIGEYKNPFQLNFYYVFLPCIVAIYQYSSFDMDSETKT